MKLTLRVLWWRNVLATSLNTLVLNFDEAVENSGLINKSNYEIRNASNELLTIQSINVQGQSITITTSEALNVNPNTIKISNLQDLLGNIMVPQSIEFSYTIAETAGQFDILINELLPDPSPVIGLPNSEFIELYNSSDKTFKLSDYKLQKSTTLYPLPNVNFLPGTYLIIVPNSDLALWSAYSNVFGLRCHKKDGGWSLEHTLKEGVCDGLDVFRASTDVSGGTRVRANTNATISENALRVINVVLSSNQSIEVCLSKTVDFSDPSNGLAFQGVNTPGFTILYSTPITACFQIQFDEPLVDGTWYKINIGPQITNCIGKKIAIDTTIGFGQGFATPEVGEVIVNEILFNPPTGGFDFVEFYNKSDKIFDLNGLIIANTLGNKTSLINKTTFIQPGEYLVFCQDPTWLKNNYNVKLPNSIQQMLIPTFNDDEGNVTLWNGDIMIDSFRYNAKMHSVFLTDDEGISLERISEDVLSTLNSNWQSAATDIGGATPLIRIVSQEPSKFLIKS
ncbi:MAG: lamin tail domain-containing protein [Saprospiraceae bacterium]|nr:lamin tail domain-containing protein [Candidatus Brachybacter algidus]